MVCVTTGLRVGEALALRVRDVLKKDGDIVDAITIDRRNMKQAASGRTVFLPEATKSSILKLIRWMHYKGIYSTEQFLFYSQYRGKPLGRAHALYIIKRAAKAAGIAMDRGTIGTHSLRKSYATLIYVSACQRSMIGKNEDPIRVASRALGHAAISSTEKYLPDIEGLQESVCRLMEKNHSYAI